MVMVRHPFKKKTFIRVNEYDKEIIVDNPSNEPSRRKLFRDLPKVSQLTQNSWNLSHRTREDSYNKICLTNMSVVGRIERQNISKGERYKG